MVPPPGQQQCVGESQQQRWQDERFLAQVSQGLAADSQEPPGGPWPLERLLPQAKKGLALVAEVAFALEGFLHAGTADAFAATLVEALVGLQGQPFGKRGEVIEGLEGGEGEAVAVFAIDDGAVVAQLETGAGGVGVAAYEVAVDG